MLLLKVRQFTQIGVLYRAPVYRVAVFYWQIQFNRSICVFISCDSVRIGDNVLSGESEMKL